MRASAPTNAFALAALLCGAALIGTSALFVKVSEAGPISTAFWRVILALPLLWAWALYERRHASAASATHLRLLVLAGVFFAGDLVFWHWSIVLTSVANATLLANFASIFVTLAVWIFFRRRPGGMFVAGLATAITGTALLLRADFHLGGRVVLGDTFGLVTAMFYAAYQLTVTRARRVVSTARLMAVSGTVTALILLPLALLSDERFLPLTAYGWLLLVGLALIAQGGGQSLIAYAMAHLPATFSSVGLLLQPVIAALLAWILLGEALGYLQLLGAALVLSGIALAHRAHRKRETL